MASRRVKRCNREPRCRVCGWALTLAGAGKWYCSFYCLTTVTEEQMDTPESKVVTTSFGKAVVVPRMTLIDTDPAVLGSGYPAIFHVDEMARIAAETPEQKKRSWLNRCEDIRQYRALKRANPSATVDTPMEGL